MDLIFPLLWYVITESACGNEILAINIKINSMRNNFKKIIIEKEKIQFNPELSGALIRMLKILQWLYQKLCVPMFDQN